MAQPNTFGRFALIHIIPFEIAIVGWVGMSILTNLTHANYHLFNLIYTPLYVVVPTMLLLFPMYVLYALYRSAHIPVGRVTVLYVFWLVMVLAVTFIALICLGKKPPAFSMVLRITAMAHVFIIPWVFGSHLLTRRFLPYL